MSTPIPKLPGYSVNLPPCLSDKSTYKRQTLKVMKGYSHEEPAAVVDPIPAVRGDNSSPVQSPTTTATRAAATAGGLGSTLPKWVENDKKVLRFYGYFQEAVVESNIENHRVRRVIIYYYLEDDTIHVAEPKQDNSGLPQGVFIKRHRVPKEGAEGSFITATDFTVGQVVTMYGRTFFLTECDEYTRQHYKDVYGVEQEGGYAYPNDPVDAYREAFGLTATKTAKHTNDLAMFTEARLGKPSHLLEGDRLKQFLANSKRVLRFWCVWDDRSTMYGDRRPYVLHYYLEDDSVEILERLERNAGRDPFPVFLKRAPLPKVKPATTLTGRLPKSACYKPEDLRLGMYINVHGRDFLLHDCDDFTRSWYHDNLGSTDEELTAIDVREAIQPLLKPALPPFNGYGTLDDSKQNCIALVPKPPQKDMHKLMNKDKIILRFYVRLVDTPKCKLSHADQDRRFVLSYFMMDDTMLIFEPPIRNSGIGGGKFLERQRVYKPDSEEIYTHQDLYAGGVLEVFSRAFEMLDADEYTYTYMENNKHMFIMADAEALVKSLKAQVKGERAESLRAALADVASGSGEVTQQDLEGALSRAGIKCTKHQVVALRRRLDKNNTGSIAIDSFISLLGLQL